MRRPVGGDVRPKPVCSGTAGRRVHFLVQLSTTVRVLIDGLTKKSCHRSFPLNKYTLPTVKTVFFFSFLFRTQNAGSDTTTVNVPL